MKLFGSKDVVKGTNEKVIVSFLDFSSFSLSTGCPLAGTIFPGIAKSLVDHRGQTAATPHPPP